MLLTSEILESLITYIRKALYIYKRDFRDIKESLYLPQILKILKSLFILLQRDIGFLPVWLHGMRSGTTRSRPASWTQGQVDQGFYKITRSLTHRHKLFIHFTELHYKDSMIQLNIADLLIEDRFLYLLQKHVGVSHTVRKHFQEGPSLQNKGRKHHLKINPDISELDIYKPDISKLNTRYQ